MIIKFDHITYVAPRNRKEDILPKDSQVTFVESGLRNVDCKRKLMRMQQDSHDLFFYDNDYPVEYVFYDKVLESTNIMLKDGIVYGEYYDIQNALAYLKIIFGNKVALEDEVVSCNMKGVIDRRDYPLVLRKAENRAACYVDDAGYGVIALINNKPFTDKPLDGINTGSENLVVNNRLMCISFVKSESTNLIFEMITIINNHI